MNELDDCASHRLCLAPMLEWTDRHFRYFIRLLSKHTRLYTEMVTTSAILHGDRSRLLAFDPFEKPLALQLGGCHPTELNRCAQIAESAGFDEVNLNVGCPSDRVQNGRFGACLMAEPALVRDCVAAMAEGSRLPVTLKTRIGIDDRDSYEELHAFVATVAEGGCSTFIIHARKAWLKGLSPKENREIPPLRYDVAARLKTDFPALRIVLNGGIDGLDAAARHLDHFDGVMIGRAAYHDPYLLADADRRLFGEKQEPQSRLATLDAYFPYVERQLADGVRLQSVARHILGLFHGVPGGRKWRRYLSENAYKTGADLAVLRAAAAFCSTPG